MNEIPEKAVGKIVTEGNSFSTNESILGRVDLKYFDKMTDQSFTLKFKCFTKGNFHLAENTKLTSMRNPKRRLTENLAKPNSRAKVSPMYDYIQNAKEIEMGNYYLREENASPSPKKKLNKINFVVKETTNEGENMMASLRYQKRMPLKELFQSAIASVDINLNEALSDELCFSDKDPVSLRFEIKLNEKVPASFNRPVDLISRPDFDQKREEMIQSTVYRRSKTLVQANAAAAKEEIEKALQSDTISVVSMLELYCNRQLLASCEVNINESQPILGKSESKMIAGSVQKQKRFLCCLKRRCYLNYIFCLVDQQLSEQKSNLTFKLKAQNGLVKYFQYIDFKLKERIEKDGECYSDRTIQGYSVYVAKKQGSLSSKKETDYFELVGSIVMDSLKVRHHFSLLTSPIRISHRLKVYLSTWPYTFSKPVGEVELRISRTTSQQDQLDIMPEVLSFLTFSNSEPHVQCSL